MELESVEVLVVRGRGRGREERGVPSGSARRIVGLSVIFAVYLCYAQKFFLGVEEELKKLRWWNGMLYNG